MPKQSTIRLLQGTVLGFGAPVGWMAIEWLFYDVPPHTFILNETLLFLYLLIGTVLVFAFFGYLLGSSEDKLSHLSFYDQLSQLANRFYFVEQLKNAFTIAKTRSKPLALLYIDIDNFKTINDQFGHHIGDLIIQEVGSSLNKLLRTEDIAGRLGGEEFAVIVRDTEPDAVLKIAERVLYAMRTLNQDKPELKNVILTVSVGICYLGLQQEYETLLQDADTALYQAKEKGKNQIVVFQ